MKPPTTFQRALALHMAETEPTRQIISPKISRIGDHLGALICMLIVAAATPIAILALLVLWHG